MVVIKTQPPPALRHIRANHGRLRGHRSGRPEISIPSPGKPAAWPNWGARPPPRLSCPSCAPLPALATSAPPLHLQLTDSLAPPARRESRQPPRFPPPPSFIRNGSSSPGLPFVSPPAPLLSVAPARAQLSGPGAGYARARVLLFRRSQPRLAMPPSPPPPSSLHHQRPTTPPPALSRFPSGALAS
ncbi:proline-rich receptor-like protein kinase PERK9 [Sorghum bicolor]|uniref:proline-rich receptor-like protein kinase PERK9 n=1 Tax=Sorghum bicolor TaxID=4558 RepID=UPI000B423F66|nr:proline-rich receptor-like protein kinase PERK9 [Sorghum bicolor]|eukprot:XP_021315229.1 proline-rich receptor-like protein kinase PERK9 [Sorghum bicolor]